MSERDANAWCAADDCPASLCNGPHVEHVCGDDLVTARFDNPNPCPGCGKPLNARPGDTVAARIPDDMMPDTPWDVMPDTPWDDDEPDADYVRRCESTVHTDPPLRCEQAVNHEGVHRIDSEPDRTVTWLVEGELAIGSPDFWPLVAAQIFAPYTYDLSDRSHLLDVVQIVCEAADDVLKKARVKR